MTAVGGRIPAFVDDDGLRCGAEVPTRSRRPPGAQGVLVGRVTLYGVCAAPVRPAWRALRPCGVAVFDEVDDALPADMAPPHRAG